MEIATKHNQRQIKINTRLSLLLVSISIYKNYEPGLEVLEFCVISDECSYLALLFCRQNSTTIKFRVPTFLLLRKKPLQLGAYFNFN